VNAASPDNRLQRSGHDKVQAPDCRAGGGFSGQARRVRRTAAERGTSSGSWATHMATDPGYAYSWP
jgi:hypothetical protein